MTALTGFFRHLMIITIFMTATAGMTGLAFAQDEDLSDNEVCLDCHEGGEWVAPENPVKPRVHNDDGSFIQEDHDMWSCIDCHESITDLDHSEKPFQEVNCENCHETTPEL